MLSLIQAEEIKNAVVEYLKATYNFDDKRTERAFEDFLYNKRHGMFKGPYIQIRLPFKRLEDNVNLADTLTIQPNFRPYLHQYEAFQRLSSKNNNAQPVILTTGTGSGKTESFLYPLLDYCFQNMGRPGIKAVILYPMNALATDQARRLAEMIHNYKDANGNYVLRDKIRAGLFIGEGKSKGKNRPTRMEENRIIEDRDTIVQSPPDILLTNFKMLDFSLMQARFHNIWKYNYNDSSLLKYIVLDELHTYDGAKGSDVANLIRRLKLKLSIDNNYLVPVGTSATMAGGDDGKNELVKFFSLIFGTDVDKSAIVEEKREDAEMFFDETLEVPKFDLNKIEQCDFYETDEYESYIDRQLTLWGYSKQTDLLLGQIKKNKWLYELVLLSSKGIVELDEAVRYWIKRCFPDGTLLYDEGFKLVQSLTGILSFAKEQSGTKFFPFVYFQTSYWIRSLHRIIKKAQPYPLFAWESDINPNENIKSLPPYYCRDCGGTGWIGVKKEKNDFFEEDLSRTRQMFMADRQNKNVYFVSSLEDKTYQEVFADDYYFSGDAIEGYLNPETLEISDKKYTDHCFKIFGVRRQDDDKIEKVCPHCNSRNTLALIGTGLPTLESIVAAQLMATATDPADDHDRKLLAFTNGVQDAAHQAGFIESRNYRFGMRHAIQSVLKANNGSITLPDLYKQFDVLWREKLKKQGQTEDAYIFKYLPPDCESRIKIDDYREKDKSFKKEFLQEFFNRISWEIWSEFSYNAGIGRTLEKSGASAVEFDNEQFADVYNQIKYWLEKETLGNRINQESFSKFLLGFLHRLRFKGGVDHIYLKKYRSEKTNYWLITQNTNKKHFMIKNFGKNTRLPKFATLSPGPNTAAFEIIQTQGGKHNWYSSWFLKCFPLVAVTETALINEFYQKLFEYLEANKLLDKKVAAGINNVGLNPDQLLLTTKVVSFECPVCGNALNIGEGNTAITEGMACLQHRCTGHYIQKQNVFDYYRMVYNRGRALRIFAKDHTGLIDREKREILERDFKLRPTYQSTNVLVATSTLEMGIDIGDLNIAFNASIPPETSNYLQRVGRAGRSSGTSLIVNLAGRDEHDQYFFEDTMAMMQGDIRTPSCYLGARDILRRHFMAYCFDSWATLSPSSNNIPPIIRLLRLRSLPLGDGRFVFNQIAEYLDKNKSSLFNSFKTKYNNPDALVALQQIELDLKAEQPVQDLRAIQGLLLTELNYYLKKRAEIESELKKLPSTGPETEALLAERRAVSGAIHNVNNRNSIEYLTNLGILPNYAFPETGVHINAQIISKTEDNSGTKYRIEDFGEIVRPASSAITELAPGNIFYSQGHKLESQGLEIYSTDEYETWRFCSNCDALALDVDVPKGQNNCPKCQHNSWGSLANKKTLVKLKGVLSVNDREGSKINDSSDDRERKFYNKSVHLKTDPKSSRGAKVLKRVPFGIEFYTSADYIEVNTGIREEGFWGSRKLLINEKENPEVGFVVCKTCGKATERPLTQRELDKRIRSYHFGYCKHKTEIYQGQNDDTFNELYIYRTFQTEALKILLPVQDFRSSEKVSIFKAGLLLGLKSYYKGHPDHVHIREYDEHNIESGRKERFLVMYESIPGGTGYLSRLFNTDEFTRLLNIAYEHIKHCTCKDEGKDGCYKCIYTYANQYDREILSRAEAENLFKEIIEKANEWNEVSSLSNLSHVVNNEESELEERFIELLKNDFKSKPNSDFEELTENGFRKYRLTLKEFDSSICYEIWPQNLNYELAGVKYATQPDFVFKCISHVVKGVSKSFDEVQEIKDIIVYLDGYQFHATNQHKRVVSDLKRRDSIIKSNRYHLWIFSWEDIISHAVNRTEDNFFKQQNIDAISKIAARHPVMKSLDFTLVKKQNNYMRFATFIKQPILEFKLKDWSSTLLFSCQSRILGMGVNLGNEDALLQTGNVITNVTETNKPDLYAYCDNLKFNDEIKLLVIGHPGSLIIKASVFQSEPQDDYDKSNWELFWQVYNLVQFHDYLELEREIKAESKVDELTEILSCFDKQYHPIVTALIGKKIPINSEYDFELLKDDTIVAQATLGSEQKKFFINPFNDESREEFLKAGYKEIKIDEFNIDNI
ncbi:MAG TPA: DEAD/DEAH box helicase [Bacteroidia bacterium]|nr:DEAD/DEAH box helicase [Bacteroidia bacterium]